MKTCLVAASVSLGAALAAVGANFPLGTYVYTGSVMNYRHEVLTSADGVSVQAVATNGTGLAMMQYRDLSGEGMDGRNAGIGFQTLGARHRTKITVDTLTEL